MVDWRRIAFFLGVPLAVAVYAAANNWAVIRVLGYPATIMFYLAHAFVPWWTTCLVTQACKVSLRRWQPPQLVLLIMGTAIACVLVLPYSNWLTISVAERFASPDAQPAIFGSEQLEFWSYAVRASIVWIVVNLVFDRWVGLPRYRYEEAPADTDMEQPASQAVQTFAGTGGDRQAHGPGIELRPRFLGRLPEDLDIGDVVLLKAEQHYIQVHTRDRRLMTLYRFSDAVAELDADLGLQVHRSFWVNKDAIDAVRKGDRKMRLDMADGSSVPVSGPNQALVEQLARTTGLPVKPITRGS